MSDMADCRYKKRLQFYLDGWIDERGARDIEKHLKHCPECQVEMADLAELNNAALEMIDEAPDREYWDSFATRVRNRILSRNVEPVQIIRKAPWYLSLRLASVIVVIFSISAVSIALLKMGQMSTSSILTVNPPTAAPSQTSRVEPLPPAAPLDVASAQPEVINAVARKTPVENRQINNRNSRAYMASGNDKSDDLALKNPIDFIREKPQVYNVTNNAAFGNQPIEIAYSGPELIDPSYRMKSSFVGQRIMAGLAQDSPDKSGDASYSFASDNSPTSQNLAGDEIQSTWGYLRVAADTSKTNENKKYFIELELMQTK
jgi:anti-sigma factor RsiW